LHFLIDALPEHLSLHMHSRRLLAISLDVFDNPLPVACCYGFINKPSKLPIFLNVFVPFFFREL
ncbi:hypothetical protein, partial [Providencia stuartii]|uniref:hypothetical protein n=1 Tax=Providencia stuartii TaxID=588 RepID=UPI001E424BBE